MIHDMYVHSNQDAGADRPPACPHCNQPLHGRWLPRDHSHEWRFKCFPCNGLWWRDELPLEPLAADAYAFLTHARQRRRMTASRAFSRTIASPWTPINKREAA